MRRLIMTTTKVKERLYSELDKKKKEYKNIVKNNNINNYNELLRIEREINSILNEIKENKRKIREKNKYQMKDLRLQFYFKY